MLDLGAIAARGAAIAVRAPGEIVCYEDLALRAGDRGKELRAAGVGAGHRVLLGCRSTLGTIVNALALLEQRCAVLPVAADTPRDSLLRIEETFAPRWQVDDETALPRAHGPVVAAEDDRENVAQALLSSGSSGQPKIVLRSAAHVEAGVRIFVGGMSIAPGDRVLALVPLEHSFGFNSVMLGALTAGAEIVFPQSRHPRGIIGDIETAGVTVFPAPPLFFDMMRRFAERRAELGGVRVCLSVGDTLGSETHTAFVETFGAELWQSYGASECGPALLNRSGSYAGDTMCLGEPYPEVTVQLRTQAGAPAAAGEVGEIVVCSPAVALGYLGETDDGSRIADREFFTGDLACTRCGELQFAGRKKLLIARAGRKVDPAEIERVLRSHPDVVDAAVRVARGGGQEPLQALVVTRCAVRPEDLIDLCARSLQTHKVPRIVEFRTSLPRDATGKLQRDRLGET